uniref:Uncharacterized protein n=1 Tax=Lepeophtheirus salmonis TaxID=72036 RepID=A0A0K2U7A7_LEPSM
MHSKTRLRLIKCEAIVKKYNSGQV